MKLKYQFEVQEVNGEFIAEAVGKDAANFGGMIRMNKTSAFVFDLLRNDITEDEIVRKMYNKYDAEESLLRDNVREFTQILNEAGLLIP